MGQNCPNVFEIFIFYTVSPWIPNVIILFFVNAQHQYFSKHWRSIKSIAFVGPKISRSQYPQSLGQFCPFTPKTMNLAVFYHFRLDRHVTRFPSTPLMAYKNLAQVCYVEFFFLNVQVTCNLCRKIILHPVIADKLILLPV